MDEFHEHRCQIGGEDPCTNEAAFETWVAWPDVPSHDMEICEPHYLGFRAKGLAAAGWPLRPRPLRLSDFRDLS
jgi:hypothetical protein